MLDLKFRTSAKKIILGILTPMSAEETSRRMELVDGMLSFSGGRSLHYEQCRRLLNQEILIRCTQDTGYDPRPGRFFSIYMPSILISNPLVIEERQPIATRTVGSLGNAHENVTFQVLIMKCTTQRNLLSSSGIQSNQVWTLCV